MVSSFIRKDCIVYIHAGGTSFYAEFIAGKRMFLFFQMTLPRSVSYYFFSIDNHPCLCAVFDAVSCNIDIVLSVNPSANLSLEALASTRRTSYPVLVKLINSTAQLCQILCIPNDFSQIMNFPTWIFDYDGLSHGLLGLFLTFDPCISSAVAFPPILIMQLSHFSQMLFIRCVTCTFLRKDFDYPLTDWIGWQDHIRDVR